MDTLDVSLAQLLGPLDDLILSRHDDKIASGLTFVKSFSRDSHPTVSPYEGLLRLAREA
jgi:hypothetical protein